MKKLFAVKEQLLIFNERKNVTFTELIPYIDEYALINSTITNHMYSLISNGYGMK